MVDRSTSTIPTYIKLDLTHICIQVFSHFMVCSPIVCVLATHVSSSTHIRLFGDEVSPHALILGDSVGLWWVYELMVWEL